MSTRDLGKQRRDYQAAPLRRESLDENPFVQFSRWYADAEKHCPGYPNPMVLSTVDAQGQPYSRVVLLKNFDDQGFVFYTNYESRKSQHIQQNAQVSLLFFWEPLERQVIIQGTVEKYPSIEADQYFASRPRRSQIAAWASEQSETLNSRESLEKRFLEIERTYENSDVPRPPNWGGYLVSPHSIEFWQGQPDRMHDRMIYLHMEKNDRKSDRQKEKKQQVWEIRRLSP